MTQFSLTNFNCNFPLFFQTMHWVYDIRRSISQTTWSKWSYYIRISWMTCIHEYVYTYVFSFLFICTFSSQYCYFVRPGPWFNIKMTSYQYRKSHCGDKTILRPSYLHNGISYTGKTTSLYWIRALDAYAKQMNNWISIVSTNVTLSLPVIDWIWQATSTCNCQYWHRCFNYEGTKLSRLALDGSNICYCIK